jgi:hypothetical protein
MSLPISGSRLVLVPELLSEILSFFLCPRILVNSFMYLYELFGFFTILQLRFVGHCNFLRALWMPGSGSSSAFVRAITDQKGQSGRASLVESKGTSATFAVASMPERAARSPGTGEPRRLLKTTLPVGFTVEIRLG